MVSAHGVVRRFWSRFGRLARAHMMLGVVIVVLAAELVAWLHMRRPRASQATASLGAVSSAIGVWSEGEVSVFELEYGALGDTRWGSAPRTDLQRVACSRPLGDSFYFPTG